MHISKQSHTNEKYKQYKELKITRKRTQVKLPQRINIEFNSKLIEIFKKSDPGRQEQFKLCRRDDLKFINCLFVSSFDLTGSI